MKLLKIMIPCLLLGACVFGTSKSAKFYTPLATASTAISTDYAGFVGVNRIQLPKYIERPQIVTQRKDSAQINISEYNRWVEFPSVLATRILTENLSVFLPTAQIKVNQFKGEGFDKIVSVEVITLNAVLGDKAEVVAWYTVKDKTGKVHTQQKFASMIPIGKTYEDLVRGYSLLFAQLSQEIAGILINK